MNLALGNVRATDEEMYEACKKAAIYKFIRNLPDGLDTVIGKDGIDMSGGQKQRLAIARIYLKNPKILIFDEATSALDYESEKLVHAAWVGLTEDRTTITIAHRLSTIIKSDRVAVLKDGKIVALGHHLLLLKESRYYRDLFEDQYT
jgi:ABC-type multidrug transport system fused ATPase/permease subunit